MFIRQRDHILSRNLHVGQSRRGSLSGTRHKMTGGPAQSPPSKATKYVLELATARGIAQMGREIKEFSRFVSNCPHIRVNKAGQLTALLHMRHTYMHGVLHIFVLLTFCVAYLFSQETR